jgi:molybdate transport system substrate-binding protein
MHLHRFILFLTACFFASMSGQSAELRVMAAASLSDVLRELAPIVQQATGHTLSFSFGASGTLARQLKEGAPADAIISADVLRIEQLEAAGLLLENSRRILVENTLVVIVAADRGAPVAALSDLAGPSVKRLAMGEPATVPAGTYAKEHLEKLELWNAVKNKLVPVNNVRAVLSAVESGNADAGLVYRTDALASRKVRIACDIPREEGPRIRYPAAVVGHSKHPSETLELIAFLAGEQAHEVWVKHGFLKPE